MLSEDDRQSAADALQRARETGIPCRPPSVRWPRIALEDAYDVQRRWVDGRTAAGAVVRGRKIGLTTRNAQISGRVSAPGCGVILDRAVFDDGVSFAAGTFLRPRIEAELAFVLARDLAAPDARVLDVMRATEFVVPAFEIVDERVDGALNALDTIADNCAFGAVVLGTTVARPFDLDVRRVGATLARGPTIEASGLAAAVMGHPASSIAWLVRKLAAEGSGLKAGDVIIGGSFTGPIGAAAGETFLADFGPLGTLSAHFS